ncbi:MAG TPA: DUF499 domain-containing protein [Pyrinomonadaceae bacterium]|jgi:hypothetical protein|nr:DUF499 domain-containing protein [Pyrinomonadaceae bacterium]
MTLKPWYKVATPREDLREGKPLDAAEFAVHLDKIRDGSAPREYQNPEQFFARTYLTENLTLLASEVIRRLSGEHTETSAVFNMATQFGGGKTHALTLLYHLAKNGSGADTWSGVRKLLERAGVPRVPEAATAVFVGTEFDSLSGRGGDDGTPLRRTPWGEIAYQLGGEAAFKEVAEHDAQLTAPAGDVIRRFLPQDKPCLILIDEMMHYISRVRKKDGASQVYNFLHSLSETARGADRNMVLCVALPAALETEMNVADQSEYIRLTHLLNRLGKSVIMSAENETSEIIRRRLFEWDPAAIDQHGKVLLPREAIQTCHEYADWVVEHRQQLPALFDIDNARQVFTSTYPFHPTVISVFDRKWQSLPSFQRTRGILRLLALWVSRAYHEGFKGAHKDPLIGLGTAPLDDSIFRTAVFDQLGERRLEVAVTTDITGKPDSHAVRLDKESVNGIKKARLHRKAATVIFFESNGGQGKGESTLPEVRLAVAEPELDIGNVETVLETLGASSYYLTVERNKYRFSLSPNLNKLLADRRASIQPKDIEERVRDEVLDVFKKKVAGVEFVPLPEKSGQVLDRPILTLIAYAPDAPLQNPGTLQAIEQMTRECGTSSRTFKSALVWCVADASSTIYDEARKVLAWEDIESEAGNLRLDEGQQRQLKESLLKAKRDITESVWRTYKNIVLLDKDNKLHTVDLGFITSSAAGSLTGFIINRLRQDGDVQEAISPNFLVRNWSPVYTEWSTKQVRDAFFASPQFPRLLNADAIKETIAKGVSGGQIAYIGKTASGEYEPFQYNQSISPNDVEISDDMFIITKETAQSYEQQKQSPQQPVTAPTDMPGGQPSTGTVSQASPTANGDLYGTDEVQDETASAAINRITWTGEIPSQKWSIFYQRVLSKFAVGKGLKLTLQIEVAPEGGVSPQKVDETRLALRELGLTDDVEAD